LAGVHVFESAEIHIRKQILDPCVLLDSGLRDYEIKLDPGFSPKREKVELDPKLMTRDQQPLRSTLRFWTFGC
jgi:hypothetical protein